MNRIEAKFKELKKDNKKAFITYIAAGDPGLRTTEEIVKELSRAGADIVELGIPFSDPLADGPTIQSAINRSLSAGCTVKKVMTAVSAIRKGVDTPIVFMTYYNLILNYGLKKFVKDSVAAGADGIIVPDLPLEESSELKEICDELDFCLIMLTAPTTPPARFKKIARASKGFIYYVSVTGVTGARTSMSKQLKKDVKKLKKLTKKPVCVGFGVSTPEQAKDIASSADGVIVGSAIIKVLEKNLNSKKKIPSAIGRFARPLAKAVHGV